MKHFTLFPKDTQPFRSLLINWDPSSKAIPVLIQMNVDIRRDLGSGKSFILTYGVVSYDDVFGGRHSLTFCRIGLEAWAATYIDAQKCQEYNGDDSTVSKK
jgi:hypothetical protein